MCRSDKWQFTIHELKSFIIPQLIFCMERDIPDSSGSPGKYHDVELEMSGVWVAVSFGIFLNV